MSAKPLPDITSGLLPKGVSLDNVPDWEKPYASHMQVKKGNLPEATAHVAQGDLSSVYVDNPKNITQGALDHEIYHQIQNMTGQYGKMVQAYKPGASASEMINQSYEGEIASLDDLRNFLKKGGKLADLNSEQQATLLQNYYEGLDALQKGPQDERSKKDIEDFKAAYTPLISQEQAVAGRLTPDQISAMYKNISAGMIPKK